MAVDLPRRALLSAALVAPLLSVTTTATAATDTTATDATATAGQHRDAARRLRALERDYAGRIGLAALNTGTGAWLGHRAGERFAILSTFKVLASGAVLRKARRSEPGLMDKLVRYTRADLVPNSPITEQHVDTGMTVAALCAAAIEYSDNTAGNLLLDQLGGPPAIGAFARTLGDRHTRLDRREIELNTNIPGDVRDTTTPADMLHNLRALTLGDALDPRDRDTLTGWLRANTTGANRLRAGLPPSWTVGDKTGTGDYAGANDLAIAWPPHAAPVLIALYTTRRTQDAEVDEAVLAECGRIAANAVGPR